MNAALFPGQGSQYLGMSRLLTREFPWTQTIFEEASDALNENLQKLCEEGPEDKLQLTSNAQPCILVTSYAWYQVVQRELGFQAEAGAGHSLGEYSALLCAGACTLNEAVVLVRRRGELMQDAVPFGLGKMAAVIGLSDSAVSELCEKASRPDSLVVPANFNSPNQVVIAGHATAIDRLTALNTKNENPRLKAKKIILLRVSAPFHSPLMKDVKLKFAPFLKSVSWQVLQFPITFNVDAVGRREADLASLLTDQIDHPVLWTSCIATLEKSGSRNFIEMGPGKVLSGLVKRISDRASVLSLDSMEDFRSLKKMLKGGNK